MMKLLLGKTFNLNFYQVALQNFKAGSIQNLNGLYNDFKTLPNDNNPVIKSFFPLTK